MNLKIFALVYLFSLARLDGKDKEPKLPTDLMSRTFEYRDPNELASRYASVYTLSNRYNASDALRQWPTAYRVAIARAITSNVDKLSERSIDKLEELFLDVNPLTKHDIHPEVLQTAVFERKLQIFNELGATDAFKRIFRSYELIADGFGRVLKKTKGRRMYKEVFGAWIKNNSEAVIAEAVRRSVNIPTWQTNCMYLNGYSYLHSKHILDSLGVQFVINVPAEIVFLDVSYTDFNEDKLKLFRFEGTGKLEGITMNYHMFQSLEWDNFGKYFGNAISSDGFKVVAYGGKWPNNTVDAGLEATRILHLKVVVDDIVTVQNKHA